MPSKNEKYITAEGMMLSAVCVISCLVFLIRFD